MGRLSIMRFGENSMRCVILQDFCHPYIYIKCTAWLYCVLIKKIHKVKRTSSQVKDKFLSFRFQLSFPSVLFNKESEYMPGRLLIRIMLLKFVMFFQFAIVALFSIKYFQLCNKSPINQDCSGPYQENVGSLSFFVQT